MKKLVLTDGGPLDEKFLGSILFPTSLPILTEAGTDYEFAQTSIKDVADYDKLKEILLEAEEVYVCINGDGDLFFNEFILWLNRFDIEYNKIVNKSSLICDPYRWYNRVTTLKNDAVFFGCSWTDNKWVDDNFASIVSKNLNSRCLNLGIGGGSNYSTFKRFLETDFIEGQIVVYQLTTLTRTLVCDYDNKVSHTQMMDDTIPNINALRRVFSTNQIFYDTLQQVEAVVKIARSKKLKLVVLLKDYKQDYYNEPELMYLCNFKEFIYTNEIMDCLVDLGTDGLHPGVESNKIYAREILKHIGILYK